MNQIRGKVAKVLTDRRLVINRGTNDGVEIGMRFAILANQDNEIRDPDTGKTLGTVELVKTIVKIVQVEAEYSIGKTFRTLKEGGGGFFSMQADMNRLFRESTTRVETLGQSGRFSEKEIASKDSYVERGDLAFQTVVDVSELETPDVISGVTTGTKRVTTIPDAVDSKESPAILVVPSADLEAQSE